MVYSTNVTRDQMAAGLIHLLNIISCFQWIVGIPVHWEIIYLFEFIAGN